MFHVPENRRITKLKAKLLDVHPARASDAGYGNNGCFLLPPLRGNRQLWIIASDGLGWEHVSVHAASPKGNATPNWDEMCYVKDTFWDPEDTVMQIHPRRSEYVHTHETTLHLWRPTGSQTIPEPPYYLVGAKDGQTVEDALREADEAFASAAVE